MNAGAMVTGRQRWLITVHGVVQGVGFRPFVYLLAGRLGLSGEVANGPAGVRIEVEGPLAALAEFEQRLLSDAPPLAAIESSERRVLACRGGGDFQIMASELPGAGTTFVPPDVATCTDCLAELGDPADRRYRYPFVNCTNCGPRYTIITGLPYDRPATTMAGFAMCQRCAAEYRDPADRRFHAQPIACPDCGPVLRLDDATGAEPGAVPGGMAGVTGDAALSGARQLLAAGAVVAVKGLGGYHLACLASDEAAVGLLRKRKDRGDQPFAVMVADLAAARELAEVDDTEARLLSGPARPIVLLSARPGSRLAPGVAPGNHEVGIMLAYTPLHALLLADQPLVMTSANLSGEPIVTDDAEARSRLAGLADAWLWHDRPIQVACDDSVVRVVDGAELPVRRSRGFAPLPIALPVPVGPTLATGGDLKNTFCLAAGSFAWLSGHIGDMDDLATWQAFDRAERQLERLTGIRPQLLATDRHPAYRSARWADEHAGQRPVRRVQHHHAHLASCLADNHTDGPVIGFAFDGTGFGDDGAVWGGEVLQADYAGYRRLAHLGYVRLPGGDAAIRNPCRMALSHLRSAGLTWDERLPAVRACTERAVLARQLATGLNCVPTSSMGRLFDAVSALAGVCQRSSYEAQAAMQLQSVSVAGLAHCGEGYSFGFAAGTAVHPDTAGPETLDAGPVLAAVVADALAGTAPAVIGARFHLAVAALVGVTAERQRAVTGLNRVALSGGVFLNGLLLSLCCRQLRERGFEVLRHRQVPPSDAGLALGQLMIAAHEQRRTACA